MVHYAEIDGNGMVLRVIVCDSKEWCESEMGGTWVRTYYATPGKVFAGIGFMYHSDLDNFSPPQPYPSWQLDANTMSWIPPVPYPEHDELAAAYVWDEDDGVWAAPS